MKRTILSILIFLPFLLLGQEELHVEGSCAFNHASARQDFYAFDGSDEANKIIKEIMKVNSLGEQNFMIKSADCKNALATSIGKDRYILYSIEFMENFKKDAKSKWMAYCVFAHEVGHHLNDHDFKIKDARTRRKMEMEADKYAGHILFNLGAKLEEAQYGIEIYCNEKASETHPSRSGRKAAIAAGWKQAQDNFNKIRERQIEEEPEIVTTPKKRESQKPTTPPQEKKETQLTFDDEFEEDGADLTEVSDLLLTAGLVGNWGFSTSDGFNTQYQQTNFFKDGSGFGYVYNNGVLAQAVAITWYVEKGQLITNWQNTGQTIRYTPEFYGNDVLALTVEGSNGSLSVPVGTIINLSRVF